MRIYTKTGDKGQTSLFDGTVTDKDSLRVEAYGAVDELGSFIGLAALNQSDEEIKSMLICIQKKLFFVAGQLATVKEGKYRYNIRESDVEYLESAIDMYLTKMEHINAFIVPGTSESSARLHVARTVCRRAERRIVELSRHEAVDPILIKFINRLSDALYAMARYAEDVITVMDFDREYGL